MTQKTYHAGYLKALEDVQELLDNALANEYRNHDYDELSDQLIQLKDEFRE